MVFKIDYISTGKVSNVTFDNQKTKKTAIYKTPISNSMFLSKQGLLKMNNNIKGTAVLKKLYVSIVKITINIGTISFTCCLNMQFLEKT